MTYPIIQLPTTDDPLDHAIYYLERDLGIGQFHEFGSVLRTTDRALSYLAYAMLRGEQAKRDEP